MVRKNGNAILIKDIIFYHEIIAVKSHTYEIENLFFWHFWLSLYLSQSFKEFSKISKLFVSKSNFFCKKWWSKIVLIIVSLLGYVQLGRFLIFFRLILATIIVIASVGIFYTDIYSRLVLKPYSCLSDSIFG